MVQRWYMYFIHVASTFYFHSKIPREGPGVKSRMCPPYPQRDRKRRLLKWGGVSESPYKKGWSRVVAETGTLKNPTKCLWRWEPDRRSNFFNPPAHLCAVTYMTEISLIVTLNNQFTSPPPAFDFLDTVICPIMMLLMFFWYWSTFGFEFAPFKVERCWQNMFWCEFVMDGVSTIITSFLLRTVAHSSMNPLMHDDISSRHWYENKTNHPISSNSHPSATAI